MTIQQLNKIRVNKTPFPIQIHFDADDYGQYSTGVFKYGTNIVVVSHNGGKWELTIRSSVPLGIARIKELRRIFIPDDVQMAHIMPKREMDVENSTIITLKEVKVL